MVPLAEFLALPADERGGKFPFVWGVDAKNRLARLLVTEDLARASEERLSFWRQLKGLAGLDRPAEDAAAIAEQVRADLIAKITSSLGVVGSDMIAPAASPASAAAAPGAGGGDGFEPCWVETPECTACDECVLLAPKTFAYNDQKKIVVINPKGAKYADVVKAAEKCTAGCIHPGTPWNPAEPGLEKLAARAAKFN
jgi:pyruvate-ferredoxin/flavodoxin oxidoreductase